MPGLAVVLVGEDPASQVYVRNKARRPSRSGWHLSNIGCDASTGEAELLALIDALNADPAVHGILVQLPLPAHLNSELVINAIDPAKDVDGFHISNVGLLGTGQKSDGALHAAGLPDDAAGSSRVACRAECGGGGAVEHRGQADGAASAGRQLHGDDRAFAARKDLAEVCRRADILVAAVGRPEMITGDMVQAGGDGDRRRHQPDRAGRQGQAGGRRGLCQRGGGGGGDHAGAGRRRADDDCLPSGQYADRLLPGERAAGAGGADGLKPRPRHSFVAKIREAATSSAASEWQGRAGR